jgi:hypothetical protein
LGFRAFGPVGFWVYRRWDFGPLASETGNLKFQCEVRSRPKPNNATSPSITSAVHRRPSAFGLWALAVGVLCLAAFPCCVIISTSSLGARLKFNSSAVAFGFWLWVFGPLGLGVLDLGFLSNAGRASSTSRTAGALGLGGCHHGVEVLSCHERGVHTPGNASWCPGCHGASALSWLFPPLSLPPPPLPPPPSRPSLSLPLLS